MVIFGKTATAKTAEKKKKEITEAQNGSGFSGFFWRSKKKKTAEKRSGATTKIGGTKKKMAFGEKNSMAKTPKKIVAKIQKISRLILKKAGGIFWRGFFILNILTQFFSFEKRFLFSLSEKLGKIKRFFEK